MPRHIRLNLDCSKDELAGDFMDYSIANPQGTIRFPNNPHGRVWWTRDEAATVWAVLDGRVPARPGDPKSTTPRLAVGDTISVGIRDNNNRVTAATVTVVFGRVHNKPNQAPVASPFRDSYQATQTTFTGVAEGPLDPNGEWFVFELGEVDYPNAGARTVNFNCYIGAVVTYTEDDGSETVRHFGLDPEMDVPDYGGGSNQP